MIKKFFTGQRLIFKGKVSRDSVPTETFGV
jgi:hypothetical protein